jgi:diguanylate cyclase (GGDEF)-like protein
MEILLNYLRDVIYNPEKAVLDIEKLPDDFQVFGKGLVYFTENVMETKAFAEALSRGDLADKLPSRVNEIAAPLKSLHASLKHLTWQAQQIANGDYTQRVAFMGEFADAFNMMVEQLAERQKKLESKMNQIKKKSKSLEQSNLLLTNLMQHVPQQIIVLNSKTNKILLMNDTAKNELINDDNYMDNFIQIISESKNNIENESEFEINYLQRGFVRYFLVKIYFLEWKNSNAEVLVISDISATKNKIEELKNHAYRDSGTQLYNRAFGMLTIDNWLYERKQFSLIFADLDGLKYVNDEFGHNEGDDYIKNAAKHLKTFSPDAVICRIGGDEFLLLVLDTSYDEAHAKMCAIYHNFENDESLKNKKYVYSISFGIFTVEKDNNLPASDILSIADERMYENKRIRKKARQN